MPTTCAVIDCGSRAKRDQVRFFRFPTGYRPGRVRKFNPLAQDRRQKWIRAVRRDNLTDTIIANERICAKHFISGRPADLDDVTNPDWVPSLRMGYEIKKTHAALVQELQLEKKKLKKPDNLAAYSVFPPSATDESISSIPPSIGWMGNSFEAKKDDSENYHDLAIAVNELLRSRDDDYFFGQFVAGELRSISSPALKAKLQKAIQIMVLRISEEDAKTSRT